MVFYFCFQCSLKKREVSILYKLPKSILPNMKKIRLLFLSVTTVFLGIQLIRMKRCHFAAGEW